MNAPAMAHAASFVSRLGVRPSEPATRHRSPAHLLDFALAEPRDPAVTTVVLGAYWPIYLDAHESNRFATMSLLKFGAELRGLVRHGKRVDVILAKSRVAEVRHN